MPCEQELGSGDVPTAHTAPQRSAAESETAISAERCSCLPPEHPVGNQTDAALKRAEGRDRRGSEVAIDRAGVEVAAAQSNLQGSHVCISTSRRGSRESEWQGKGSSKRTGQRALLLHDVKAIPAPQKHGRFPGDDWVVVT